MRFHLRSLFVLIAVVAVLLTWYARGVGWVHERTSLLQTPGIASSVDKAAEHNPLPLAWKLAGAKTVRQILVHPAVNDEFYARLQRAFPEAEIIRESSGHGESARAP